MRMTSPHKTTETVENKTADAVNARAADEPPPPPPGGVRISAGVFPEVGPPLPPLPPAPPPPGGDNPGDPGVLFDGDNGLGGEEDGAELVGVTAGPGVNPAGDGTGV